MNPDASNTAILKPLLIGLVGHKGSGKNLSADFICAAFPQFHQDAFANTLKEVCAAIFGLTEQEMHDPATKEQRLERYPFQSPREIMQKMGTEAVRSNWPEAWIEAISRRIKMYPNIVITDVRFSNEAEMIRERGGKLVRISRPRVTPENEKDLHASETVQDKIEVDKELLNDGSPGLLRARVLAAVWELLEEK